jgi:hypothetical protein
MGNWLVAERIAHWPLLSIPLSPPAALSNPL